MARRACLRRTMLWVLPISACVDSPTDSMAAGLRLEVVGGDGQRGLAGWTLEEPLTVRVVDVAGAGLAGVEVSFTVESGAGSVGASRVGTSALGLASTSWTFGDGGAVPHRVRASITQGGGASVTFDATAFGEGESDFVIVRGALGPLRGVVMIRDSAQLRVATQRLVADTAFSVPPVGAESHHLVVFGHANRPLRAAPTWTAGVDTVSVTMEPPVPVDLDVDIQAGSFEGMRDVITAQIVAAEDVFTSEAMGVVIDEVVYQDHASTGTDLQSISACVGGIPPGAIQLTVVRRIDNGAYTGLACPSGHVFLALDTQRFPFLLAHELGHTFTLPHTQVGLMRPNPGRTLTEGEIYRAHFHSGSSLNTIFAAQPVAWLGNCLVGGCLPMTLDLEAP